MTTSYQRTTNKYLLTRVGLEPSDMINQMALGFTPETSIVIRNEKTMEKVEIPVRIENIKMLTDTMPERFRFIAHSTSDFRISGYYYPEKTEIEGFISAHSDVIYGVIINTHGHPTYED